LSIPLDADIEQHSLVDTVVAFTQTIKRCEQLVESELRQITEPSEIDTENRDAARANHPCGPEHRAVTAKHHDEVQILVKLVPPQLERLTRNLARDLILSAKLDSLLSAPHCELTDYGDRLRLPRSDNDPHPLEFEHGHSGLRGFYTCRNQTNSRHQALVRRA